MTRARHERDMAGLRAEAERLRKQRDEARDERDAFHSAARAAARQVVEADERRPTGTDGDTTLIEGGRSGRPNSPISDRDQAKKLAERLAELQAATERCTCGGAA
ncbi:hypothetical protein [Streptomyces griseorubiginosus]|uniref:hypothetical protein n=1 Tax=Streptomyces griseorubiginosus TaxID=67304 RepID=UPI0036E2E0C6